MKYIAVILVFFLASACSTGPKMLQDFEGGDKAGIAFDSSTQARNLFIIAQTKDCLNLNEEQRGLIYYPSSSRSRLSNKKIGVPEILGMSAIRREFWLSAKDNIAMVIVKDYHVNKILSGFMFKPEPNAFYYVDNDYKNGDTIMIYKIVRQNSGIYKKVSVTLDKLPPICSV